MRKRTNGCKAGTTWNSGSRHQPAAFARRRTDPPTPASRRAVGRPPEWDRGRDDEHERLQEADSRVRKPCERRLRAAPADPVPTPASCLRTSQCWSRRQVPQRGQNSALHLRQLQRRPPRLSCRCSKCEDGRKPVSSEGRKGSSQLRFRAVRRRPARRAGRARPVSTAAHPAAASDRAHPTRKEGRGLRLRSREGLQGRKKMEEEIRNAPFAWVSRPSHTPPRGCCATRRAGRGRPSAAPAHLEDSPIVAASGRSEIRDGLKTAQSSPPHGAGWQPNHCTARRSRRAREQGARRRASCLATAPHSVPLRLPRHSPSAPRLPPPSASAYLAGARGNSNRGDSSTKRPPPPPRANLTRRFLPLSPACCICVATVAMDESVVLPAEELQSRYAQARRAVKVRAPENDRDAALEATSDDVAHTKRDATLPHTILIAGQPARARGRVLWRRARLAARSARWCAAEGDQRQRRNCEASNGQRAGGWRR